jgi:hypothetical protein
MHLLSIFLILLILSVWMFFGVQSLRSANKETGGKRWLTGIAAIFAIVGAFGFFGAALSATGGLNWLPTSFEWPVGFANGVVSTRDHFFVVPHTPSGRVQVYDSNWKFVRGWHVDAGGGTFKLSTPQANRVEVITARGQWHYVFDLSGKLLSKENYGPGSYSSFSNEGESCFVPTAPWLCVFSSPLYSWLSAIAGIGLFIVAEKLPWKKSARIKTHSYAAAQRSLRSRFI